MLTARDIMTSDVETATPDDDVADVLTRLARADFNGFPIVDGDDLVGIVTKSDMVDLFQPSDRTLWIPIGFPPFLESQTYAIDLSWDELDVGIDLVRNANRSISDVMTSDVVTVTPDDDIDTIIELLADEDRDINRLPVTAHRNRDDDESHGTLLGIVTREDVLRALRDERVADLGA